jgi:hypothetical protein
MFISQKALFIRNLSATLINSLITLILLLIAPLGLVTVVTNTVAVGLSTFFVSTGLDLIIFWLIRGNQSPNFPQQNYNYRNQLSQLNNSNLHRQNQDNQF